MEPSLNRNNIFYPLGHMTYVLHRYLKFPFLIAYEKIRWSFYVPKGKF